MNTALHSAGRPLPWRVTKDRIDGHVNIRAANDEWVAHVGTEEIAETIVRAVNEGGHRAKSME